MQYFPYRVAISVFVSMLQILILSSYDPLARIVPFLLKATDVTHLLCPYKVAISFIVLMSHSLIVLSFDPLARIVPVLLNATEVTPSECP